MQRLFLIGLSFCALSACKASERAKGSGSAQKAAPPASSAPLTANGGVPGSASADPEGSASATKNQGRASSPLDAARRLLEAWNRALNAHDADALASVYAPSVRFYGQIVKREKVIALKRAALRESPSFSQELSDVRAEPDAEGATLTFWKQSGVPPHLTRVRGKIVVALRGGDYAVVVESDDRTDARAATSTRCADAALEVALRLPEVQRLSREAGADAAFGGVTYSAEGSNVSAALGFNHPERFESVFFVDVAAGKLSVSEYGEPLALPAPALEKVKAACAAPAK